MKIITKVFYDLDRPNTAPTTPLVKEEKNFPNKHLPPSDKARISSEFYKLRADIQEKPLTPEDSAKERDRIIALLNTLEFHRHLQVVFDAIITTQFVPKELIQAGKKALDSEGKIFQEIFANVGRMTIADKESISVSLFGGVAKLTQVIALLSKTVIEIQNPDGTTQKLMAGDFLSKNLQK